jgi:hypothetical protein
MGRVAMIKPGRIKMRTAGQERDAVMTVKENSSVVEDTPPRRLSDAAKRALDEAEARRKSQAAQGQRPAEVGGRDGPEPTRFGDWEKGGIASDF